MIQLHLKNVKKNYAVLWARRSIAVTRSQFLRLLLRDHPQAAGVRMTVAGHTSLNTALVIIFYDDCPGEHAIVVVLVCSLSVVCDREQHT